MIFQKGLRGRQGSVQIATHALCVCVCVSVDPLFDGHENPCRSETSVREIHLFAYVCVCFPAFSCWGDKWTRAHCTTSPMNPLKEKTGRGPKPVKQ